MSSKKNDYNKKIRIVVIDSGWDYNCKLTKKISFGKGKSFFNKNHIIGYNEECQDEFGHGTGVISLIYNEFPDAEIIPIKVINKKTESNEDVLIAALEFVLNSVECDLINISMGIQCCKNIKRLHDVCRRLNNTGKIIISASDNSDVISYPAGFDCVIGVGKTNLKSDGYAYSEGPINILFGEYGARRTYWLNNKIKIVSGNSFLAPHVTAVIAKELCDKNVKDCFKLNYIKHFLKGKASCNQTINMRIAENSPINIKKAIAFPFNKEVHSIARFKDLLSFNVIGFFDTMYSGNVGKSIDELQNIRHSEIIIKAIEELNWEDDFDAVILGHIQEMSRITKFDWAEFIVSKCERYHKQIYSFSDISSLVRKKEVLCYFPKIENDNYTICNQYYPISTPCLGVFGTGSKQGKFTLQLQLKKELIMRGLSVGHLSTEPSSLLLGADAVYPMGYESTVHLYDEMPLIVINHLMANIEKMGRDVIIFGGQSHCLFQGLGDEYKYPFLNFQLLLACQSEAYILCYSANDSIEYLQRCVAYLETIWSSKVLALVLSPFKVTRDFSGEEEKQVLDLVQEKNILSETHKSLGKACYSLRDSKTPKRLCDILLEHYFVGEVNEE